MCSRKWAMPVAPRASLREPTRYHIWNDTMGLRWSSCSSTRRPFSRVAASTRSPDWAAAPPAARTTRTRATRNARIVLASVSSGFYAAWARAARHAPSSDRGRGAVVRGTAGRRLRARLPRRRLDPGDEDQQGEAAAALRDDRRLRRDHREGRPDPHQRARGGRRRLAVGDPRLRQQDARAHPRARFRARRRAAARGDRKSTRLNSSHLVISYAVFCLKKKKKMKQQILTK